MRGGVPHLGGLLGQPCRVTRLGGVSFLHVNAEGGVGWCSAGHLSIIKPIERLNGWPKNVKFNAQYVGYTGLTFLRGYTKWKGFWTGPVGAVHKDTPMFSLAIDSFDKFGLERLTEPEKPLNEMSSDCK